jgi:asparagine synthase (glutamine-hydrolysing)
LSADFLHAFAPVLTDSDGRLPPNASRVSLLTGIKVPWFADPLVQWDVEWRDPTSDRRLVEYLLSLPLEAFTLNGRYRGLARAMGERLLPESVRQRRTQGSQVPEHSSMLTAHAVKYQRALAAAAKSPLFRSICDLDEISKALRDLAGGSMDRLKAQTVDRALDVGLFIAALEAAR